MRILVTFAVEAEFAPWRNLREFKKNTVPNGPSFARRFVIQDDIPRR